MDHLRALFGSDAEMARRLGVTKQTVSWWRRTGLPARRAVQLVALCRAEGRAADEPLLLGLPPRGMAA